MSVRCVYTPMHFNVLFSLLNPTPFQALLGESLPALGMDTGLTGVCSDSVTKSSVVALHWSACKHTETWRSEPWEKLRVCRTDISPHEHRPQEHEVTQICLPSIFIWHPVTLTYIHLFWTMSSESDATWGNTVHLTKMFSNTPFC